MTEIALGENRAQALRDLVEAYVERAHEVSDGKDDLKEKIQLAKEDGFNADALKDVIKERGMDGAKLIQLHMREHARTAYRRALGLPTNYDEAVARFGEDDTDE
jgi:uncharacterized protein (UPF0335 family)